MLYSLTRGNNYIFASGDIQVVFGSLKYFNNPAVVYLSYLGTGSSATYLRHTALEWVQALPFFFFFPFIFISRLSITCTYFSDVLLFFASCFWLLFFLHPFLFDVVVEVFDIIISETSRCA